MLAALVWLALAAPPAVDGVLPPGASWLVVATFEADAGIAATSVDIAEGAQPVIAHGDALIPLGTEPAIRISGVEKIDSFAFSPGGALLLVSGRAFGVVTEDGFSKRAELPMEGMRVVADGVDAALLVGGTQVLRVRANGKAERLAESPEPIDAVASDAGRVLLSTAGAVVEVGSPSKRLMLAGKDVKSLAVAPHGAFFYATDSEVGYARAGTRLPFLWTRNARIAVRDEALFVIGPDVGILRVSPISAFGPFAEKAAKK